MEERRRGCCNLQSDFFTSRTCTLAIFSRIYDSTLCILHCTEMLLTYRQITDTPNTVQQLLLNYYTIIILSIHTPNKVVLV